MAIKWSKRVLDPVTNRETWLDDGVTHVGLVMYPSWTTCERVMSDVYADVSHVRVWNPAKGVPEVETIGYHFELGDRFGVATVDIDPKILAVYEAEVARKEALAAAARRVEDDKVAETEARARVLTVKKGAEAVVTSGRKVKVGTRGTIIWTGTGNYGSRVGLKDAAETVHWTSESNITVVLPGGSPTDVPAGGWRALEAETVAKVAAVTAVYPKKGERVRVLATGLVGHVFWVKVERLGVHIEGTPKTADPVWCNAWEVAVLTKGGVERAVPTPESLAVVAPKVEVPAVPAPHPLAAMPAPFCEIRKIAPGEDGTFNAYSEAGGFLLKLSPKSAARISALLGA